MIADFSCDDAGRLTAKIADAKGEFHDYSLARVLAPSDAWTELLAMLAERRLPAGTTPGWACILVRLDSDDSYFVCRLSSGRWICECADWMYRSHKSPDGCKHCQFARPFRALDQLLARVRSAQGPIP